MKRCVVVLRAPAAIVLNQPINLQGFHSAIGPVDIIYDSRWVTNENGISVPGDLWIEVSGNAPDLDAALPAFANAGLALLPVFSVSANAAIREADVELGFELTSVDSKRQFFQSCIAAESPTPHALRRFDGAGGLSLYNAFQRSGSHAARFFRAANQYRLALDHWRLGRETMIVEHLWMAVEALAEIQLRKKTASTTPEALASELGTSKEGLKAEIIKRYIFHGDHPCYKAAREVSNGFEHGYGAYSDLLTDAKAVRHQLAKYVRDTIIDLANLPAEEQALLTLDRLKKPLGYWPLVTYVRARLVGEEPLSAPGYAYPMFKHRASVKQCHEKTTGEIEITLDSELVASTGTGTRFEDLSYEVWQAG